MTPPTRPTGTGPIDSGPTGADPTNAGPGGRGLGSRLLLRTGRVLGFVGYYGYEFLKSNLLVIIEILRPRQRARPAIVELRLRASSPIEIVSLANLISLAPGTLALETALDPPTLYVHGMFGHDPEGFLADLRRMEDWMLAAMRPVGAEPKRGGDQ